MLRSTRPALLLPLPLYKMGSIVLRQVSRPVVQLLLDKANRHDGLRRGFIYVGWLHYRATVTMQRMIWGAELKEQEAKVAKEKEVSEKVMEQTAEAVVPGSGGDAAAAVADASSSTVPPKEHVANIPPLSQQQEQKSTQTITVGGAGKETADADFSKVPGPSPVATAASKAERSYESKLQTVRTSPRTIRIIPRSLNAAATASAELLNPMRPIRHVQRIFIAPPRPSDEELLKNGMKLVVELGVFLIFCIALIYELWSSTSEAKEKAQQLEDRFVRLEKHMLNCPGALPGDKADVAAEIAAKKDEEKNARREEQQQQRVEAEKVEENKNKETTKEIVVSQQEQRVAGGEKNIVIERFTSLNELWGQMSLEARVYVVALFAIPYAALAGLVLRLFLIVGATRR